MTSSEIRRKFLEFFKNNGHAIVPSSSLIPEDPSVLLTTAGMQQFKSYYTGDADPMKDFGSKNIVSIQKCFRTSDIDEVGDESHLTFFEMLGNFSFGGYFKEKAIQYGYDFITKEMELKIEYVTIFDPEKVPAGDWRKGVSFDAESEKIWKRYGVRIEHDGTDVFWGPTGNEGPCGPTTEIYVNTALRQAQGKLPLEVWNVVFNEFYRDKSSKLTPLKTPGVDTGMGLERLTMVVQKKPTIFETDLFEQLINKSTNFDIKKGRILVDHLRGAVHLIADGVEPSNKDRGYILRRILRRVIFQIASFQRIITTPLDSGTPKELDERVAESIRNITDEIIGQFGLVDKKGLINSVIRQEIGKSIDLLKSLGEVKRICQKYEPSDDKKIPANEAFLLYSSLGITYDFLRDEAKNYGLTIDEKEFEIERKKHQEISRAGSEKKFGGHGLILDTGELKAGSEEELKKVIRLHTATHLLQKALREVLGSEVQQRGSDITTERTRFDFSFPRKMTPEEMKKVEEIVNEKIKEDLPVGFKEMPKMEAEKTGALFFFKAKYPEEVKVYYVGKSLENAWSKEFCGGPHVTHTGEIGKFKITKEEPVAAGIRRIRATVE